MSNTELLNKLKDAMIDIDDDLVMELMDEAVKAGIDPMDIINDGLAPGLMVIGEGFDNHTRFTSDLVLAGDLMTECVDELRPIMEKGSAAGGKREIMIIGTVEGDQHNVGKRIVSAMFTAAGYTVIDIGEDQPATEFVKAAKEYNAKVVGASAILTPQKPYCKVIHDGLVEAGIREDLVYIVGGWGFTQEWCDKVGADAYGDSATEALARVNQVLEARGR